MPRPRRRFVSRVLPPILAVVLALSACSSGDDGDDTQGERDPATTATATATATATEALAERCGVSLPEGADAAAITLGDGQDVSIKAAEFGDPVGAETVLVLLHQTGSSGLCGWGIFAALAAGEGLPSVAIDLCDWGESTCPESMADDAGAQVDLAVTHAREVLGASRVVLVGASMGGSMTVMAVAAGSDVDAWVDVSGPSGWAGVLLADLAPQVAEQKVPGLVVQAHSDGEAEYAAAQALARDSRADFLDGGAGHGYELLVDPDGVLLPAGSSVIDFARAG